MRFLFVVLFNPSDNEKVGQEMEINETAYQHALAMNKGKTFSVEGGAEECFRYFVSCYDAAKQPVSLKDGAEAIRAVFDLSLVGPDSGFKPEDIAEAVAKKWGLKWK